MSARPLEWSIFGSHAADRIMRKKGTWPDLLKQITNAGQHKSKASCPWIKFARFGDQRSERNSLRHDANVVAIFGVEADYDGEVMTPEQAIGKLEAAQIKAAIYTSPSHTPEKPRWRVLAPLSKPHAPEARASLVARINGVLGGVLAGESFTLSQSYYFGQVSGVVYQVLTTFDDSEDGTFVDELDELDSIAIGRRERAKSAASAGATDAPYSQNEIADKVRQLGRKLRTGDGRRELLKSYIASASARGIRLRSDVMAMVRGVAAEFFDPSDPLDAKDVQEMVRWATQRDAAAAEKAAFAADRLITKAKAPRQEAAADPQEGPDEDGVVSGGLPFASEQDLAETFANVAINQFKWSPGMEWMHNKGTYWGRDDLLTRYTLAKLVCKRASFGLDNEKLRSKICSASTTNAVLSLARSAQYMATPVEAWDAHPMLLNTPAGVVDLATGREVQRDGLLFTQITGTSPAATPTPMWDKFLNEVFAGDLEMVEFMQRMGGYSLTGSIKEQKLFFLHGNGANGKSVFLDVLRAIGGQYSYNLPSEALMTSKHESHPTMLASLHGKRLAISSEIEESAHWAEARIKAMTGDETLTARYMRQDFFTFRVSHKHIIAGNFKPRLKGDDFAMVRRMILVPFSQRFEGARRDNNLPDKLKAEYPGILAWFIEGARKWAASGLAIPTAITEASKEYMAEQDDIGLWIESRCERVPGYPELASTLFASFDAWKAGNGEHAGSAKTFSQRLERSFDKKATNKGKVFKGLRLLDPFTGTGSTYAQASRGD